MFPTIGSLPTYTVLVDIGILATLGWLWSRAPKYGRESRRWFDAGLLATLSGLIGARLLFVFANWGYFGGHLGEAFAVWRGGLAWPGAALGALGGLLIYCRRRDEPFRQLLHVLAPAVLGLAALSWLGCAAAGCAPGLSVDPGELPIAVDWPDEYGIRGLRWPTQLLGVAFSLLALGWLTSLPEDRWPPGVRTAVAIGVAGLISFSLGWVRNDTIIEFSGWRLDVIGSAVMVVLAMVLAMVLWWPLQSTPEPEPPVEDSPAA